MTTDANIVVIGAGIIGASVAYHLADMGVDGVIVVDKGDITVTDGSTSHAPGGLRTLTASHFFTTLGVASRAVYDSLPLAVEGEVLRGHQAHAYLTRLAVTLAKPAGTRAPRAAPATAPGPSRAAKEEDEDLWTSHMPEEAVEEDDARKLTGDDLARAMQARRAAEPPVPQTAPKPPAPVKD